MLYLPLHTLIIARVYRRTENFRPKNYFTTDKLISVPKQSINRRMSAFFRQKPENSTQLD
jgi:hypothetical protein